ncbi:hypothetical protein [Paraburkholderia sp. DGU8]|uniref:hypothetical protein n=1 Tax=Paraburkholderia sp. DGU8 TaxID=3161997 RepID=UPI003467ECC5
MKAKFEIGTEAHRIPLLQPVRLERAELVFIAVCFAASRLLIAFVGYLSARHFHAGALLDAFCRWDCTWYQTIFERGYDLAPNFGPGGAGSPHAHVRGDAANWAFFPLYPLSTRILAHLSGLAPLACGYLLSNAAFLGALYFLYCTMSRIATPQTARFSVLATALAPWSLYFAVPYTEALYLLLMLMALESAAAGRWITAGVTLVALSATRNLGVLMAVPLMIIAVQQFGWPALLTLRAETQSAWLALLMAPLGLALFMLFLHARVGDSLAFMHIQLAWGRHVGNPLVVESRALLSGQPDQIYYALSALLGLAATLYLLRNGRLGDAFILATGILIPLSTLVYSMPRYVFTLYSIPLALGLATENRPKLRVVVLAVFAGLLVLAVRFWIMDKEFMP